MSSYGSESDRGASPCSNRWTHIPCPSRNIEKLDIEIINILVNAQLSSRESGEGLRNKTERLQTGGCCEG